MKRILRLTLKRKWFDMIASGDKKEEYRKEKPWILSRLVGKEYDEVEFRNGYAKSSPVVRCEFKGWHRGGGRSEWGAVGSHLIVIELGEVL